MSDEARHDLAVATSALDAGELGHAAHHLGGALALGPVDEVRAALDRFVTAAGDDALAYAPLSDGGVDWATAALRAALLERGGRAAEAVTLMLAAQAAVPNEPQLLGWVDGWLERAETVAAIDLDELLAAAARCAEQSSLARATAALLERVRQRREPHARLAMLSARVTRQLGDVDGALAIASDAHARAPSYWTAVAMAGAERERGELGSAIDWYRRAAAMPDADVVVRLDEGDLCLEERRYREALDAYEAVAAAEPDNEWARESALFVRSFGFGDAAAARALEQAARANGASERARQLYAHDRPYRVTLPPPATTSAQWADAIESGDERYTQLVTMAISSLEPPSAIALFRRVVAAAGGRQPTIAFGELPAPDPRRGASDAPLWIYDGSEARPSLAPPPPELATTLTAFVSSPFDLDAWWRDADEIGDNGAALRAAIVHPPPTPDGVYTSAFVFRVHVAAALALARLGEPFESLAPLVDGPPDWATAAGVIALMQLARAEPAHHDEVLARLEPLLETPTAPIYFQCRLLPAVRALSQLEVPDDLRRQLAEIRREADPLSR